MAIPRLYERLTQHGAVDNFRPGVAHRGFWFADSDLYKWMEAAAWAGGGEELEESVALVLAAQHDDGYLNTYFGTDGKPGRWHDPTWSHELYCAGHFLQAAIARAQTLGLTDLLEAGVRLADRIAADVPDGWRDHHPVIEMALVELYRTTGMARHLDLAIDLADRAPWRELDRLWGHAVCALYFASGLTDIAIETGDAERQDTVRRWYRDLLDTSIYITGAVGGRWVAEAVGLPYELPQARSYTETCASVAAMQWHERMHRLDGSAESAHWLGRTLHNAFLAGISEAGDEWFYATPHATTCDVEFHPWIGDALPAQIAGPMPLRRAPWRDVACCPPNATRWLARLPHLARDLALTIPDPDPTSPARWIEANHRVESLRGCVALYCEPFVHCFEGVDNPGIDLRDIAVDPDSAVRRDGEGFVIDGFELRADSLYEPTTRGVARELRTIPFHRFANRGDSPMIMWVNRL